MKGRQTNGSSILRALMQEVSYQIPHFMHGNWLLRSRMKMNSRCKRPMRWIGWHQN